MSDYLVPAVIVALLGLILQGIKALSDIVNEVKTRKLANQQSMISLTTALFQLIDASSHSEGEKITIKKRIAIKLLGNALDSESMSILSI